MTQSVEQPDEAAVEEILRLTRAAKVRGMARRRRRLRRRMLVLLMVLVAVSALAVFRVFSATGDGHTPSKPRTSTLGASAVASPTSLGSTPDFAWVAAKGAARYRIEFLRGGRVVHVATTSAPRLHVAAGALPPGRYRWRVWPLDTAGARAGRAIVDASLTIR